MKKLLTQANDWTTDKLNQKQDQVSWNRRLTLELLRSEAIKTKKVLAVDKSNDPAGDRQTLNNDGS